MSSKLNVIVLAAGKGTRMHSSKPKVLHKLAGISLLQHTLNTAKEVNSSNIQIVVGHGSEQIKESITEDNTGFVQQEEQLGTAHAVHQALPFLEENTIALVLYGDVPLIKKETVLTLAGKVDSNSMAVLTCMVEDPTGLGRIVRNAENQIEKIVEDKDATPEQKTICEINTGIMAIPVDRLAEWLPKISTENAQKEYYLTDIVAIALESGCGVHSSSCNDQLEASGVNNRVQLAELERYYQEQQAQKLLLKGVTLIDPKRLDIRGEVNISQDVEIDINVILEGKVKIETGVKIEANCILKDCEIGKNTTIYANSIIDNSNIGSECVIGPFARIRPGTILSDEVKIGNFVETKKTTVAKGSKINHLSYVGDTDLGKGVNIGAGTITCNYDGVNKFKTIIGDNVFVGSNSALVAPVVISDGATIGAGSVITKNVDENILALTRIKQTSIHGWQRPKKK